MINNFYQEVKPFEMLLKSIAFNLTKSSADAEDLLQETYFKAYKGMESFKNGTNFKAWLVTIMKNTFINNYRKNKREMATIYKPGEITDDLLHQNTHEIEPGIRILMNETLVMAFDNLKPELKSVFNLYYDGYKYNEIAEQLNLPLGTVKSRIFLARKEMVLFLNNNGIYNSNIAS